MTAKLEDYFYLGPHNRYTIYFNEKIDVSEGKPSNSVNMQCRHVFSYTGTQIYRPPSNVVDVGAAACDLRNRRPSIAALQNCQQFVCGKHGKTQLSASFILISLLDKILKIQMHILI